MRISDWSSDVCSSDLSLIVIGWPKRSFDLPAATRIQPSEIEYSSTSVRSWPLKRMPIPRCNTSMSKWCERGLVRLEEIRVGKECVSTCRSMWSLYHSKNTINDCNH